MIVIGIIVICWNCFLQWKLLFPNGITFPGLSTPVEKRSLTKLPVVDIATMNPMRMRLILVHLSATVVKVLDHKDLVVEVWWTRHWQFSQIISCKSVVRALQKHYGDEKRMMP